MLPVIKDIVIDTFEALKNLLEPNKHPNNFELSGYDFMIDADFRVWLLEIN